MIIFVGGPPRVGKTILARKLAKKLQCSWLSTDDLRGLVRKVGKFPKRHPIFTLIRIGEEYNQKEFYEKYTPVKIIELQNTESKVVAKIVKAFIEEISYRKRNFIIEGVALFPPYYKKEFIQRHSIKFCCVGNTDHQTFIDYSWKNRSVGDWLENTDRKTFERVIRFCSEFSRIFEKETKPRGFPYFEIRSPNFNKDINKTVAKLLKS